MDILREKIVTIRKKHVCDACGRVFEAGTKMHTQVNTMDGIQTWRTCLTCHELLSKYSSNFEDDSDGIFYFGCVEEILLGNQTPEDLLNELNDSN